MAGQTKKSHKHDRNRKSPHCLRYKAEHRHEKSHIRRITKHLVRYGDDKIAKKALENYKYQAGVK